MVDASESAQANGRGFTPEQWEERRINRLNAAAWKALERRGETAPLIDLLRSDEPITPELRRFLAATLSGERDLALVVKHKRKQRPRKHFAVRMAEVHQVSTYLEARLQEHDGWEAAVREAMVHFGKGRTFVTDAWAEYMAAQHHLHLSQSA